MSARHARPVLSLAAARAEVAAAEAIFTQMGDVMAQAGAPVAVVAPATRTRKAVTRTAAPKRVTPVEAPVHARAFAEGEITLSAYRSMVARHMVALAAPGSTARTVVRTHWDARAIVKSYTNGRHPFVVGAALVYGDKL